MGALVTADTWQNNSGTAVTAAADLAALRAICAAVDAAVRRLIRPFLPEPATLTGVVMDAPVGPALVLPWVPVRAVTSVSLHWGANGDPSQFTADDLLTPFTDYWLPIDTQPENYSRSGIVRRRNSGTWAYEFRRPVGRLSNATDPNRGAVLVTFDAGPTSVPADLELAATLAVTLLYNRRAEGAPYASESWNGRSQSLAGPFTATGVLETPDISRLLAEFKPGCYTAGA